MRFRRRVPQDEESSLTMDPLAGYGAWAAGRAQSAQGSENDDEVPSAAILLLLLGVPALLIIAALVAIVLA